MEEIKRILLAESPDAMPFAMSILGASYDGNTVVRTRLGGTRGFIIPCESVESAKELMYDNIDLILCGLDFDDSRMFDFLRLVKAEPRTRSIPFISIKTASGALNPTFYQSVEIATQTLGAAGFIDFYKWTQTLGQEKALQKIGSYIDRLVESPPIPEAP